MWASILVNLVRKIERTTVMCELGMPQLLLQEKAGLGPNYAAFVLFIRFFKILSPKIQADPISTTIFKCYIFRVKIATIKTRMGNIQGTILINVQIRERPGYGQAPIYLYGKRHSRQYQAGQLQFIQQQVEGAELQQDSLDALLLKYAPNIDRPDSTKEPLYVFHLDQVSQSIIVAVFYKRRVNINQMTSFFVRLLRYHVFYFFLLFQIHCRMGQLKSLPIALLCLLKTVQLPQRVSLPRKGQSLTGIPLYSLIETFNGLLKVIQSEEGAPQIVIIDSIVRFQLNRFFVTFNGLVIVFFCVVTSSQISVICWNVGIHCNGFANE